MKKLAIFLWLVLFVALLAVPAKAVEIIEIFLGESVIGNLSHTADRNYYKLYVSEGEHIFVNLENHLDQELEVRIYIKYGAVPPEAGWDDCDYWIDPGEEGIVEINPTNEGYYYITTISESGSGYYTITALGSAHPPFPIVDITLNKNTFHTGDTLIATARVTNGPNPVNVEVKLWIELPDGSEISVFDPHFTFTVGSNADFTEEVFIHTFDGSEPEGDYLFGARLENPLTGKDFSIDIEGFTFTP